MLLTDCFAVMDYSVSMKRSSFLKIAAWGIALWLAGYLLGILFFMIAPASLIGWFITPIGLALTIWVLTTKFRSELATNALWIGVIWMLLAIILDYFFLVQLFKPEDGYYKLDVYFYYGSTLLLPLILSRILPARND